MPPSALDLGPAEDPALDALAIELAAFRATGDPAASSDSNAAVMRGAGQIFGRLQIVGQPRDYLRRVLGPPDQIDPPLPRGGNESWIYIRGNGDVAAIYQIEIRADVAVSVKNVPSQ